MIDIFRQLQQLRPDQSDTEQSPQDLESDDPPSEPPFEHRTHNFNNRKWKQFLRDVDVSNKEYFKELLEDHPSLATDISSIVWPKYKLQKGWTDLRQGWSDLWEGWTDYIEFAGDVFGEFKNLFSWWSRSASYWGKNQMVKFLEKAGMSSTKKFAEFLKKNPKEASEISAALGGRKKVSSFKKLKKWLGPLAKKYGKPPAAMASLLALPLGILLWDEEEEKKKDPALAADLETWKVSKVLEISVTDRRTNCFKNDKDFKEVREMIEKKQDEKEAEFLVAVSAGEKKKDEEGSKKEGEEKKEDWEVWAEKDKEDKKGDEEKQEGWEVWANKDKEQDKKQDEEKKEDWEVWAEKDKKQDKKEEEEEKQSGQKPKDPTVTPGGAIPSPGTPITTAELAPTAIVTRTKVIDLNPITASSAVASPPAFTLGGSTFVENSASAFVIGSRTLTPGGVVTVDRSTVSLAPSATAVVVINTMTELERWQEQQDWLEEMIKKWGDMEGDEKEKEKRKQWLKDQIKEGQEMQGKGKGQQRKWWDDLRQKVEWMEEERKRREKKSKKHRKCGPKCKEVVEDASKPVFDFLKGLDEFLGIALDFRGGSSP